jgi:hypothetical protein
MKLPRVRFTVRRLMIVVAVLAVGFGAIKWVAEMRARSADYRRRAFEFVLLALRRGSMVHTDDGRWVDRYEDENVRRHDEWARRMEAKYLRLSYYPWLAAEPDPPPPKPLAHPRNPFALPEALPIERPRRPAWTFLWTRESTP